MSSNLVGCATIKLNIMFDRETKTQEIGFKREFLNLPFNTSTISNIGYYVTVETWDPRLKEQNKFDRFDIEFYMSNCTKTISLDFYIENSDNVENSLYKLDTIIKTCESMKKDILKAYEIVKDGKEYLKTLSEEEKE